MLLESPSFRPPGVVALEEALDGALGADSLFQTCLPDLEKALMNIDGGLPRVGLVIERGVPVDSSEIPENPELPE
ncbi:hypothetical protein H4I95_09602 [Botrytis cinerea]